MNTQIFNPTTTKVKFLKEWTPEQFTAIEKAIVKHFKGKDIRTHHGNANFSNCFPLRLSDIDDVFGMAYTSSSMYAGYWVCNTQAYFDADNIYYYNAFTIGTDGIYYAVLNDNNENELCIKL